jgi:O-antigen/teichoic acid export membrane protein
MVSEKEMGFFMAALTLVENLLFVPNAFNTSIFPAYSRMFGESPEALRKAYQKITKYLIIITSSVAIGTQIVGAEIIRLIFGDQFSASALILGILIFFWVFTFFSQTQSMLLFSVHKEKEQVMVMGGACFLTILLNFLFITLFGVLGAAYASVIVEAIVVMIFTLILWKIDIKYVPDYHILRLIFSLAGMSIAVIFMLKINFFIAIAFGAFCFLCFLFLFRVFDSEDRYYLKTLLSKEIS